MRAAHLLTVHALIATPMGRFPQVYKFEQVSSLGHQMSLAGDGGIHRGLGPCTEGEQDPEVQCIMGYGHMGQHPPMWTLRLTDTHI